MYVAAADSATATGSKKREGPQKTLGNEASERTEDKKLTKKGRRASQREGDRGKGNMCARKYENERGKKKKDFSPPAFFPSFSEILGSLDFEGEE